MPFSLATATPDKVHMVFNKNTSVNTPMKGCHRRSVGYDVYLIETKVTQKVLG